MAKVLKGRLIKAVASRFTVLSDGATYLCFARKKLKLDGDIYVGDEVEFSVTKSECIIEKVLPRKNCMIRPYVANLDVCLITVAVVPEPDFLLVDKILVNCYANGVTPIIVANKCDLGCPDLSEYEDIVSVKYCSADSGEGVASILEDLDDSVVCFAGQSAVGKSSIVNSLLELKLMETGELSKKINRGKNTTRYTTIIPFGSNYLVDTCGFSMLEFEDDFVPSELASYYPDFLPFVSECKYRNSCTHTGEPDCGVKMHIGNEIGEKRYERYVQLYGELLERWNKKYD